MKIQFSVSAASIASAMVATVLFANISQPAQAQQQQPPKNGWYKVCAKAEENDICNVQFQSVANTGQVLTQVSMATITGKVNRKSLQVTVPTGRFIPPGVSIKVDDKKELKLPYVVCAGQACIAELPLEDSMIDLFKSGGEMTVTSTNFQRQPTPVRITLEGFTAANDGPALKQSELEARQRQLQDELRKKAEERRKKLQEEQDKAKAADSN